MQTISEILSDELGQRRDYVENVITLLDEGNTVPFIARYRKEMHGAMDDQTIRTLADRLAYLRNLEARRQEVKTSIENQGKMTEELSAAPRSPARRGSRRSPNCSMRRRPTAPRPRRRQRRTSIPKRGSPPSKKRLRARPTSLPRPSRTTPT